MKLIRYTHLRHRPLYEVTLSHASIAVAIGIALGLAALFIHFANPHTAFDINRVSFKVVARGALDTFDRMPLAFIVALIVAIPVPC